MFKVRAYESRSDGESGRVTPAYASSSGSLDTATFVAVQLASEYGAAVVEDASTGLRLWHEAKPPCVECFGKGWNDKWKAVSAHYMGGETVREDCGACNGSGKQ